MMTMVILAAALMVILVRRFSGEPVNVRDLVAPPIVLTGLGVYALTKVGALTTLETGWLAASVAIGVALGFLRGLTIRLFDKRGVPHQRYTKWTLIAWIASLAVGLGLDYLATRTGVRPEIRPMTLSIGVGLVGELIPLAAPILRMRSRANPT